MSIEKSAPPSVNMLEECTLIKKPRNSNLELYRIICMLMIVAHHYVVNSGVRDSMSSNPTALNSIFLYLFGAWGKTGINCFMLITGYYMCTSKITLRKFVKLMAQIYFYRWLIFCVFFVTNYETLTPLRIIRMVMPFWSITDVFTSCFIVFWLTIPFWTILVKNMNQRQHLLLLLLLMCIYSVLSGIPEFKIKFNYVTWFGVLFLIASYIRIYPNTIFNRNKLWGYMTFISVLLASLSVIRFNYHFVSDSNKFFAVMVALCSFLWFKNMDIKYSKLINSFGAGTFGVLLIHANSNAMRTWLWKDTVDVIGHYTLPLDQLILYSFGVVLAIFVICNLIDQLRIATLEKWFFGWYDRKMSARAETWVNRIINV